MDHISTLLPGVLHRKGYKREANAALVVHVAQEWIAHQLPALHTSIRVHTFRDHILTIETDDSGISQELHALTQDLTAHLNADVAPARRVEQVRIVRKKA